jgi:predicted DNA-binding transcriptional regulator YafY
MRAARLLVLTALLQTRGRMTARALAECLEVSERTIYRDLDALSSAGIPVYAEPGPGGGCAMLEDYRRALAGLTESDVRALVLAGSPGPLAELGLAKALETALLKLLAGLPAAQRREALRARRRIHLDAAGWFHSDEVVPHLATIQEATLLDRRLRVTYRRMDGTLSEKVVDPYGLVAKAGVWYLVGAAGSALRTFRVSRVRWAMMTEETFVHPDDFDLAAYWVESCATFAAGFPGYEVTLRTAPEIEPILLQAFGEAVRALLAAGEPDTEGWKTITLSFETADAACGRLLGFGTLVEVLDPPELRQAMWAEAARIADFYAIKPSMGEW